MKEKPFRELAPIEVTQNDPRVEMLAQILAKLRGSPFLLEQMEAIFPDRDNKNFYPKPGYLEKLVNYERDVPVPYSPAFGNPSAGYWKR